MRDDEAATSTLLVDGGVLRVGEDVVLSKASDGSFPDSVLPCLSAVDDGLELPQLPEELLRTFTGPPVTTTALSAGGNASLKLLEAISVPKLLLNQWSL